jgi:hypothetical protein
VPHRVTYERLSAIPLPSASATECVRILVSLGWMASSWTEQECLMTKEPFSLLVPLKAELGPSEVTDIVQQAGISPLAFVDALEKIRTARLTAYGNSFDPPSKAG